MDISQRSLVTKVKNYIVQNDLIRKGDKVIIALSGGPDSVCLFHILLVLKDKIGFMLYACHFNHLLRGRESDLDGNFVKELCESYGVELFSGEAPKPKLYRNEEQARVARYNFFRAVLEENQCDKIATAHHSNDSAETYLMRLVRGSGLRGLRSIQNRRDIYIRPLLGIKRSEIDDFLAKNKLSFRVDQTNKNIAYLRNWVRLKLIPELMGVNPNIIDSLVSQSRLIGLDYDYLMSRAEEEYERTLVEEKNNKITLDAKKFLQLHPSMQNMVLRKIIADIYRLDDISLPQIDEVINMIKKGEGNKLKILSSALIMALANGKIIIYRK